MNKSYQKFIEHQEILKSKIGTEQDISSSYLDDAEKIIGKIENQPKIVVDIGGGGCKRFCSKSVKKYRMQCASIK